MKIHKYTNYQEYIEAQRNGIYNHPTVRDNINYEWVQKKDLVFITNNVIKPHFKKVKRKPEFGICHGAKLGKENMWLEEISNIDFIGTDLIIESNKKMKLLNWDFNKVNQEWLEKFDVLYSNSFDHSPEPEKTLQIWIEQVRAGGIIILEHTEGHIDSTKTDPFGATLDEYITLVKSMKNVSNINVQNFNSNRNKNFVIFEKTMGSSSIE